jgi:hypothetical protein
MSNERALAENIRFHLDRFTPIAAILREHDIRLGLEFIGPKTLRDSQKHPFIWKMFDMLEPGEAHRPERRACSSTCGTSTRATARSRPAQAAADDVVYVHVNDAPRGVAVDEQLDNVRDLPGATGVIDIAGFLRTLKEIGYDGPVDAGAVQE